MYMIYFMIDWCIEIFDDGNITIVKAETHSRLAVSRHSQFDTHSGGRIAARRNGCERARAMFPFSV